jgi:two-component system response regulator MprA
MSSPQPRASSLPLIAGAFTVPAPTVSSGGGSDQAILLLVERDPHVRELAHFFLNEAGFNVHFCEDGLSALDLARKLKPRIVVTEVIVPKLDGLALCRAIKTSDELRHTIVVVFSLLAVEQRAREAGADAFVRKPLGADRLVETVRAVLAQSAVAAHGSIP